MSRMDGLSAEKIDAIEKCRRRVIDSVATNMDLYGVTLSVGHLYGRMYFADGPVTLDEMVEAMGMSKTSMSTGMRTLMDLKMVNRVFGKGSRKDLYEVESDWHRNFVDYFSIKWRKSMEMNLSALNKSLAEMRRLREQYADDAEFIAVVDSDIQKMLDAVAYYRWLGRLIDAMDSGQIFEWIPKEEV